MGKIFSGCFRIFIRELEQAIGPDCETLLDIGCGSNSPISYLSKRFYSVGIDAHLSSIEKSKEKGIHNKYYNMDFSELGSFDSCSFDCVTALDVIEHIKKAEGLRLLEDMKRIAKKRIVVFTPNGFLPQSAHNNNPLQIHKSGWKVKEMRNLGYKVIGINGLRTLRGDYATIRFKPTQFWEKVSEVTQYFIRNHPKYAFQMLCVKSNHNK